MLFVIIVAGLTGKVGLKGNKKNMSSAHKLPLRLLFGLPIRIRPSPRPGALHRRGYS